MIINHHVVGHNHKVRNTVLNDSGNHVIGKLLLFGRHEIVEIIIIQQIPQDIKEQVIEAIRDISKGEDRSFTKRDISQKEIANYKNQQNPSHNLNNNLVFKGYQALEAKQIIVTKVTEYSNRFLRLIKYEYESKPSSTEIKQISELFKEALSIRERGNVIIVVYQI